MQDLSGLKILVIDDSLELVSFHMKWMEMIGIIPLYSLNGKEGVELFKQNKDIDLVILDLNLPDIPGKEVFAELRRTNPVIPVIVSSGYEKMLSEFRNAENVELLNKPFFRPALEQIISRLAGRE